MFTSLEIKIDRNIGTKTFVKHIRIDVIICAICVESQLNDKNLLFVTKYMPILQ